MAKMQSLRNKFMQYPWSVQISAIVAALCAALLLLMYASSDSLRYKTASGSQLDVDRFDSRVDKPVSVTDDRQVDFETSRVDIRFRMKAYSMNPGACIFQTEPTGRGIRLEFAGPRSAVFVVSPAPGDPAGEKIFPITEPIDANRWYPVRITGGSAQPLRAFFNRHLVVDDKTVALPVVTGSIIAGSSSKAGSAYEGMLTGVQMHADKMILMRRMAYLYNVLYALLLGVIGLCAFGHVSALMKELKREQRIQIIIAILVAGFAAAVGYHYVEHYYIGRGYPFNTFLFNPADRFMDFYNTFYQLKNMENALPPILSSAAMVGSLIVKVFGVFSDPDAAWRFFAVISACFMFIYSYYYLKCDGYLKTLWYTGVFVCLSYPVLFTFDRGNFEFIVFILLALFLYFYRSGRFYVSLVFLSLSIYLKLFPVVFLIILVGDKKFKEIVFVLLAVAALFFAGLSYGGALSANYMAMRDYLTVYNRIYVMSGDGAAFSHTIWGVARLLWQGMDVGVWFHRYFTISIGIFILVAGFVVFIEKALWKKVLLLVVAMNILPYVSADYKLIHLYLPLYLFLNNNDKSRFDMLYTVLFALLLIPKAYGNFEVNISATVGVIVNPLLMAMLGSIVVTDSLTSAQIKGRGYEAR